MEGGVMVGGVRGDFFMVVGVVVVVVVMSG
jgi:hypothetical protein